MIYNNKNFTPRITPKNDHHGWFFKSNIINALIRHLNNDNATQRWMTLRNIKVTNIYKTRQNHKKKEHKVEEYGLREPCVDDGIWRIYQQPKKREKKRIKKHTKNRKRLILFRLTDGQVWRALTFFSSSSKSIWNGFCFVFVTFFWCGSWWW